ncbi:cation transporter [Candidatus Bathyarchaeota archaeon]|nr:cation transporter [Candidatus Bathyarchaeota archaeon]
MPFRPGAWTGTWAPHARGAGAYPPPANKMPGTALLHRLSIASQIAPVTSATQAMLPCGIRGCIPALFTPLRPHQPQLELLRRGFETASASASPRNPATRRQHDSRFNFTTPRPSLRPRGIHPTLYVMDARSKHDDHGHSHGLGHHHHHHPHDNAYLTSKNKGDAGVRITRIGLYSNLAMAIAKGVGGYMFMSHAMVADAWHSVTDLASDVLTLATVSWSSKDPTQRFPAGYGKIESLGSLGVSGMLLVGGMLMGWSSVVALITQLGMDVSFLGELAHAGHSHGHDHAHGAPSMHAAWLAAGTIGIKEWLYHASKSFP